MKKLRKPIFGLMLMLIMAVTVSACGKPTYTVTFDANGGETIAAITETSGKRISKPSDPTRQGYAFAGWFYDAEFSSVAKFPLTLEKDCTLYAKWLAVYTIIYKDMGGTDFSGAHGSGSPFLHTYEQETVLGLPTKTGYKFGGWFTENDGTGTAVTALHGTGFIADITLYAKWIPVYTITYRDTDGANFSGIHGNGNPLSHIHDVETVLVSPAKTGYKFDGWFVANDGTGIAVTVLNANGYTENIVLHAKWTALTFTVSFNANGGDNAPENVTATYNSAMPALTENPTKEGYKFLGFFDAEVPGSGKMYYSENLSGVNSWDKTADTMLYAQWVKVIAIANKDDLLDLASATNSGTVYATAPYFLLTADIDLGGAEWVPIGTDSLRKFTGTFDGSGHKIYNFNITVPQRYLGVFGYNSGTIKNLGVEDFYIEAISTAFVISAGGLIGYNVGGTVQNCYTTGNILVSAAGTYDAYAGGIVGNSTGSSSFKNCFAMGTIGAIADDHAYAGGFAGGNGDGTTYTGCYALGDVVTVAGVQAYAGGFIGWSTKGVFLNCYATGSVSTVVESYFAYAGGFAGYNSGTLTNCYALGAVLAVSGSADAYAGGLVGYDQSATLTGCFAIGDVNAMVSASKTPRAGGLCGFNASTAVPSKCYRSTEQEFYTQKGLTELYEPTNVLGTECAITQLDDVAFYTETLGWSNTVWDLTALDFSNSIYPTLIK